jgi:hypothetical protein
LEIARAHKYISDLLAKYPMEKKRTHRWLTIKIPFNLSKRQKKSH